MNYYIQRGAQQYGPYSLADLQRYVQQGNIALNDLARSDGMTDWVPVSQIIGNVGAPPPASPPAPPAFGAAGGGPYSAQAAPYGSPGVYSAAPGVYGGVPQPMAGGVMYPPPPSLHWAVVLVISLLCGWFQLIWLFIELAWVQKVRPQSNARMLHIIALCTAVGGFILGAVIAGANNGDSNMSALGGGIAIIACLAAVVLAVMGNFTMRSAIEDFYNKEEPIGLRLSGVMTFFFSIFYFQYHFTRINEMKRMAAMQYPRAFGAQ